MKILLTGGAGYIGSHTAIELMSAGYEIVICDNFSNSKPEALKRIKTISGREFPFYEIDVADKAALSAVFAKEEIGAVIHFAGYKAVGESVAKPIEYYRNNLLNQVWNKAYKRDFLIRNNIFFKDFRYGEDRIFNAEVLNYSPVVKSIPDVLYNYIIDKSVSLISGYIPEKFDACKEINRYYSYLCKDKSTADYMFLKNIVSCMTVLFADNCKLTRKEKKAVIKEIISDKDVKNAMKSKQNSTANEIIRKIVKTENANINYLFSFSVAFIQKHFLPLFLKFRK